MAYKVDFVCAMFVPQVNSEDEEGTVDVVELDLLPVYVAHG